MPPSRGGYITAASRARRHLEMAVDLALSLKDVDPRRGFALVTDSTLAPLVERYPGVFDHVSVIPDELNLGHAAKLYTGVGSPFDGTLFIDADCLALDSLDTLWSHLESREFCVPGEYVSRDESRHHHNYPIREICRLFDLPRYYWASSPIFFFRGAGREILNECLVAYREELPAKGIARWDTKCPPDEIAFGVVGGRRDYAPFPPVQTIIKHHDLLGWRARTAPHPIYHCTMCPRPSVLRWLMQGVAERRRRRGLPQGSRRHWLWKAGYKLGQRTITRALGLPWGKRKRA